MEFIIGLNLFNDFGRQAGDYAVCGDIPCYDAVCTDDSTFSYGHAFDDRDFIADPHIVFNGDALRDT